MKTKKILVSIIVVVLFVSVGMSAEESCFVIDECEGGPQIGCHASGCDDADCGSHSGGVWCYCDGDTDFYYCPPPN